MVTSVTRHLEQAPDYSPAWRHAVVLEYLKTYVDGGRTQSWEELLEGETDVIVRQVVRYHLNAGCLVPDAIRYALRCQQENANHGLASVIRAMVIAERTREEIAAAVGTSPRNIAVFVLLFFDVERYLGRELWLESIIRRDFCHGSGPEKVRERRLLRTAFDEGWDGLAQVLGPKSSRKATNVSDLKEAVERAVCQRALEFVENLQHEGVAADRDDLERFMKVTAAKAKEPPKVVSNRPSVKDWLAEVMTVTEFIPRDVYQMVLDGGKPQLSAGRRRGNLLRDVTPTTSKRVNEQGTPLAGVENKAEVSEIKGSFQLDQVDVAQS